MSGLTSYFTLVQFFCNLAEVISEGTMNEDDNMIHTISLAVNYQRHKLIIAASVLTL